MLLRSFFSTSLRTTHYFYIPFSDHLHRFVCHDHSTTHTAPSPSEIRFYFDSESMTSACKRKSSRQPHTTPKSFFLNRSISLHLINLFTLCNASPHTSIFQCVFLCLLVFVLHACNNLIQTASPQYASHHGSSADCQFIHQRNRTGFRQRRRINIPVLHQLKCCNHDVSGSQMKDSC